ncbi:MAG: hypothetical protein JKY25_10520 [Robiginitomaculum sp.]|nr:hypothetical protein [Robiginitomaculum sp.]
MLPSNRIKVQAYSDNQNHAVRVEVGTTIEDVLKPEFWTYCAKNFVEGDEIKIIPDDFSFYLNVIVTTVGKNYAHVKVLQRVNLAEEKERTFDGLIVKLRGPKKWSVLRNDQVLAEGMNKVEAEAWADEYEAA